MSQIHTAVRGVMRDIAKTGIAKLKKNAAQGYNFRGIEDAMNEMSPLLISNGITVTPSYSDLHIVDRVKGDPSEAKATRFATVKGSFKFEAEDGSFVASECYGEAMDSGDKAVTKAQSVAFRTALFQQFVVPFMAMDPEEEGDDDSDWRQECADKVAAAETEQDLKSVSKECVPLFNKARDRDGYAAFVKLVQQRGAEIKAKEFAHAS
jgi:hypothetical protein